MPGVSSVPQCWEVSHHPTIGRVLTASRDIKSWELVIQDTALVHGPKVKPVCLGCLGEVTGDTTCKKCLWPLCGPNCEDDPDHLGECQLFQRAGFYPRTGEGELSRTLGLYSCVSIIRVLLLKQNNRPGWTLIENMMDHWKERSEDPKVINAIKVTTNLVQRHLGMSWVTQDDVEHVYGVLKTNAVDINDGRGQALFPKSVCITSHSCNANLEPVSDPKKNISFRAKRKIEKGEELTIRYTDFVESRYNIRSQILQEWKFLCVCHRCTDQTECGTNISSLKCSCGGFFYDVDPDHIEMDEGKKWECSSCQRQEHLAPQYRNADRILKELEDTQIDWNDIRRLEEAEYFHNNFYLFVKLRITFIQQNRNTNHRETLETLLTEIDLVLRILNQLDRGCSRLTGFYLQIKTTCQHKLLKMKHDDREVTDLEMKKAVLELTKMKMFAAKLKSCYTVI